MSPSVRVHGDLVEFLDDRRCEPCQSTGSKCVLPRGDDCCIVCAGTGRACVLTCKNMVLRGPLSSFLEYFLVGGDEASEAVIDISSLSIKKLDHTSTHPDLENKVADSNSSGFSAVRSCPTAEHGIF